MPNDYDDIVENLDTNQQFYVSVEPRVGEKGTQAIASLFLEHLLPVFNDRTQDDGGDACRVVEQVNDMNSVRVQATISEWYMKKKKHGVEGVGKEGDHSSLQRQGELGNRTVH